jgi:RNA-splicing ligase RtcB
MTYPLSESDNSNKQLNHFIEIGIDERSYVCVTTHSGSRNLGLRIATYWQDIAVEDLKSTMAVNRAFAFDQIRQNYPKEQWQVLAKKLSGLPISQAKARAFSRLMLAGAMKVDFDNQGRILAVTLLAFIFAQTF